MLTLPVYPSYSLQWSQDFDLEEPKIGSRMEILPLIVPHCIFLFDGFSHTDGLFLFGKLLKRAGILCSYICLDLQILPSFGTKDVEKILRYQNKMNLGEILSEN